MTDWELLQQYVQTRSADAFAELVRRHSAWVRSAARRLVRDEHLADDVTQAVFLALSQKAPGLHQGAALSTWLFSVTRYASAAALRARSRRQRHEQAAAAMKPLEVETMTSQDWDDIAPNLESFVARLRQDDQRAVLLRFYQQKSYPDMAGALGVSEEAARKRTDRAVEKLRQMLAARGLAVSISALSTGLFARTTDAAPIAISPDASPQITSITNGALQMMQLAKLKIPIAVAAFILLMTVGTITLSTGANAPAQSATTAPTSRSSLPDSPKAVIQSAFRAAAAGDPETLIAAFDNMSLQQRQVVRDIAGLMTAGNELAQAVQQKFNVPLTDQFTRGISMGVLGGDIESASETITGETAVVDIGSGPGKIELRRKNDGQWKINPAVMSSFNPRVVAALNQRTALINRFTADVRAGTYKDLAEVQSALANVMQLAASRPPPPAPAR